MVEISQKIVVFSEHMNFIKAYIGPTLMYRTVNHDLFSKTLEIKPCGLGSRIRDLEAF